MPELNSTRRFLFICGSARRNGNSETLARHAAASLPAGAKQNWLHLSDFALPLFEDRRHTSPSPWLPTIEGHALSLLEATLDSTDVVIVAPVYWYSLPAAMKLYLDHWTAWLRAPGWDFKIRMAGKTLWGISAYSDDNPAFAAPIIDSLRLTASYMEMNWGGFLLGESNRPGDVVNDKKAMHAAASFFFPRSSL